MQSFTVELLRLVLKWKLLYTEKLSYLSGCIPLEWYCGWLKKEDAYSKNNYELSSKDLCQLFLEFRNET